MSQELSSLITEYNTENGIETNSANKKCVIIYQIRSSILSRNNNNPNSRAYKKEANSALHAMNIKKTMFNVDARIGEYLLEQNDPALYTKSKRELLLIITPPKEKKPKQSTTPKEDNSADLTILQNKLHELSTEYRILQEWLDKVYGEKGGFSAICEKLQINRL